MKNKSNNSIFYMTIVIIIVFLAVASGKIGGNKEKTTRVLCIGADIIVCWGFLDICN